MTSMLEAPVGAREQRYLAAAPGSTPVPVTAEALVGVQVHPVACGVGVPPGAGAVCAPGPWVLYRRGARRRGW